MNLYWVVIYPLNTKFPVKTYSEALRLAKLASIYHQNEVEIIFPQKSVKKINNLNAFFIIGFEHLTHLPYFLPNRFTSKEAANAFIDEYEDELFEVYWKVEIFQYSKNSKTKFFDFIAID